MKSGDKQIKVKEVKSKSKLGEMKKNLEVGKELKKRKYKEKKERDSDHGING